MKTHTIKTPTAELMIVELPRRTADFSVLDTGEAIAVCAFDENDHCLDVKGISKGYNLLGKLDEIREDHAKELVNLHESGYYKDYINGNNFFTLPSKSLLSALESEIFWDVNPIGQEPNHLDYKFEKYKGEFHFKSDLHRNVYADDFDRWHEAEQKTFDRSRSIILVKN